MASPYGHTLVGLSLFSLFYPRPVASRMKVCLIYGLVIAGALAPDLDFLPGIFWGNPSRFHHGFFHSLGMAVGLSLMAGALTSFINRKQSAYKISRLVFLLIFSHLGLDFFTEDPNPPFGFPLLWPFSETYYISPWWDLPHVERNFLNPAIWSQIVRVFSVESLLFLPLFFLLLKMKGHQEKKS